jgi:hypothetical protein
LAERGARGKEEQIYEDIRDSRWEGGLRELREFGRRRRREELVAGDGWRWLERREEE